MSDEPAGNRSAAPAAGPEPVRFAGATADQLDRVVWDYDPEDEWLSPLVTTSRYFRDFPWDDEDGD